MLLYDQMLRKLAPADSGDFKKLSDLLSHWIEAENPPAAQRHEAEVAVARFLAVMGDMEVGQIAGASRTRAEATTLRRFREKLAETPHQRGGQALDARAIAKSLKALRGLLTWERPGAG